MWGRVMRPAKYRAKIRRHLSWKAARSQVNYSTFAPLDDRWWLTHTESSDVMKSSWVALPSSLTTDRRDGTFTSRWPGAVSSAASGASPSSPSAAPSPPQHRGRLPQPLQIIATNICRNFLPTRQYIRKLMAELNVSRTLVMALM